MIRISTACIALALSTVGSFAQNTRVDGYTRRDGTYVQPHVRTNPDNTRTNNYGSQGNVNPYTGQQGRIDPYQPQTQRNNTFGGGVNNLNRQNR